MLRSTSFLATLCGLTIGCGGVTSSEEPDAGSTVDAAAAEPNLVFLTSTEHAGDFGSVEFADAECNQAAQVAGLPGEYVAWVSTSVSSAPSRIGAASGWVRLDGEPFASSLADLAAGRIFFPAELLDDGTSTRGRFSAYWTGSDGAGEPLATNCGEWTSANVDDTGTFGVGLGGAGVFSRAGTFTCDREARFLCLGVDRQATVNPPGQSGRVAFLSNAAVEGDVGRTAFNLACQTEAEGAGLTGTFVAGVDGLLGQVDLADADWVRPDGTPVTSTQNPLSAAGFVAPITQSADGQSYRSVGVWTGVGESYLTVAQTCGDWDTLTEIGAVANAANASSASGDTSNCDIERSLFCFEL